MIFKIIFILFSTIFIGVFITFIEDIKKANRKKISFKEAIDLVELPVVTFISEGKKLNLLLDTGANNSILNKSVAESMELKCEKFDGVETNTAGGNINLDTIVNLDIQYDDKRIYNECFLITDMDEAFNSIKEECGITIHGILGSNFFTRNKYIIDFDSLALYIK